MAAARVRKGTWSLVRELGWHRHGGPCTPTAALTPVHPDVRLARAAAAAVPGPDRGAVRLCVPVRQGTLAPDFALGLDG
ncbi:hypothetical protein G6F40_015901 [Rhizopus arrhizus]|nr:hypothetical protein G6F40_015901 [Rhizopus arrhizus]